MEISKVTRDDAQEIVDLQKRLLLDYKTDPSKGFLVSNFTLGEYEEFIVKYEYFYKAKIDDKLVGIIMAFESSHIQSNDLNNSILKNLIIGDFILIKQVFTSPDYLKRGIALSLYEELFKVCGNQRIYSAVVVDEPLNYASYKLHMKIGFKKFLEFTPNPDADGKIRKRSAWIKYPDVNSYLRVQSSTEDSYSEVLVSERMHALLNLYNHEDSLNWKKFTQQITLIIALFAGFAFLLKIDNFNVQLALGICLFIVGIVINWMFYAKINSGLKYMELYKNRSKEYDKKLSKIFGDQLCPIFKDGGINMEISKTCKWMKIISFGCIFVCIVLLALFIIVCIYNNGSFQCK